LDKYLKEYLLRRREERIKEDLNWIDKAETEEEKEDRELIARFKELAWQLMINRPRSNEIAKQMFSIEPMDRGATIDFVLPKLGKKEKSDD